jgi:hypothetical protein
VALDADGYVRIAPHEERVFSLERLWRQTWRRLSSRPVSRTLREMP